MEIKQQIASIIAKELNKDAVEIQEALAKNEKIDRGNFSLPCFKFAKELNKSPQDLANELKDKIVSDNIEKVEVLGGFLNIFLKKDFYVKNVLEEVEKEGNRYGSTHIGKGKKALVEHTSINPNASPHIGRARNALIGDSIVNILKFNDYDVEIHYFVNDIGKQIAILVIGARGVENVKFDDLLDLYAEASKKVKESPELEKEVFDVLDRLENGDEEIINEFRKLVSICIEGQTEILGELGIHYDSFDYESDFILNGKVDEVLKALEKTGKLFEVEDGRLAINQEEYNLPIKSPVLVITRANKTSLYSLRDIAYTIYKDSIGKDRNVIVLGEDQRLYFKQLSAALDLLGYKAPEIIHYSFVLLPEGKMSTRNKTVVLMEDFMKEVLEKTKKELLERDGQVDLEKAKKIAYGTVKYTILRGSLDKNVIFDMEKALSFNGETSLYIQYNYARINSILKKANFTGLDESKRNYDLLNEDIEIQLIQKIENFKDIVETVTEKLTPNLIANYVYDLTKMFSNYYHDYSILNAENEDLVNMRLQLIKSISIVIKNSLDLLGIETIDKM